MNFFAGYGNIVPKTVQGRLFCVLYPLIGIPGTWAECARCAVTAREERKEVFGRKIK